MKQMQATRWHVLLMLGGLLVVGCGSGDEASEPIAPSAPAEGSDSTGNPPTVSRLDSQDPAPPPRVVDQPEAPEPAPPADPEDYTSPCLGPDYQPRERLAPTAAACDALSDETRIALYSGDAAIESMRACTFEGTMDRRPYTAIVIPRAIVDGWDETQDQLIVSLGDSGVEVRLHDYQIDGVTTCRNLPMGDLSFGAELTREGESAEGTITLRRLEGDRIVGLADITLRHFTAAYEDSALRTSAQIFGAETLW